eukprot:5276427-Prymnesium_polylepis.2
MHAHTARPRWLPARARARPTRLAAGGGAACLLVARDVHRSDAGRERLVGKRPLRRVGAGL